MGEISRFMVTGMVAADAEPTAPPKFPQQKCSISSSVASFTLDASHSQPFTTTIVVWKFFCFWRNVTCRKKNRPLRRENVESNQMYRNATVHYRLRAASPRTAVLETNYRGK